MTPLLPYVEYRMNQHNSNEEHLSEPAASSIKEDQEPPEPGFRILVADEQQTLPLDEARLQAAVQSVLDDSSYSSGMISIAVVDDPTIHAINRQYLEHDYPTDVLSFALEDSGSHLEGELVVSSDTAAENAQEYGWPAADELLLYVIHGCLHLVGYRDKEPADKATMHNAELEQLRKLGVPLPSDQSRWLAPASAPRGKVS